MKEDVNRSSSFDYSLPSHFPQPTYNFSTNPIREEVFQLGRVLFYDPILSVDNSIACADCHHPNASFIQPNHPLSHGVNSQFTFRNSMPIMNLAWSSSFGWDGGVFNLDLFAVVPITAHNEMGETMSGVLTKLQNSPRYQSLFSKAFGSSTITTERFLKAISQFQLKCISADSRYDRWLLGKTGGTFSASERKGYDIFQAKCKSCHSGILFTDFSFRNNGLAINNPLQVGRYEITKNEGDKYKFKVPSLRNIMVTAPYMHDGRYGSIDEVLEHYNANVNPISTLDSLLRNNNGRFGIPLSSDEKAHLKSFLSTLTDSSFINNPILDNP